MMALAVFVGIQVGNPNAEGKMLCDLSLQGCVKPIETMAGEW